MVDSPSPQDALRAVIGKLGSQAALARLCGVSSTAVWKWLRSKQHVPAEFVLKIEAATGVSRHELRPDLYPREDPPAQPPAKTPPASAGGSPSDACEGVEA